MWTEISERYPYDHSEVLVTRISHEIYTVHKCYFHYTYQYGRQEPHFWCDEIRTDIPLDEITGWMPLPKPFKG